MRDADGRAYSARDRCGNDLRMKGRMSTLRDDIASGMRTITAAYAKCSARLALGAFLALGVTTRPSAASPSPQQPALGVRTAPILTIRGQRFRDLNRNGVLDGYEDWRLPTKSRVADLVARMTLEEKAGDFGISEGAPFDALTGRVKPVGRLPFELPSSMTDVEAQSSGAPHDSKSPLYPIGYRHAR